MIVDVIDSDLGLDGYVFLVKHDGLDLYECFRLNNIANIRFEIDKFTYELFKDTEGTYLKSNDFYFLFGHIKGWSTGLLGISKKISNPTVQALFEHNSSVLNSFLSGIIKRYEVEIPGLITSQMYDKRTLN